MSFLPQPAETIKFSDLPLTQLVDRARQAAAWKATHPWPRPDPKAPPIRSFRAMLAWNHAHCRNLIEAGDASLELFVRAACSNQLPRAEMAELYHSVRRTRQAVRESKREAARLITAIQFLIRRLENQPPLSDDRVARPDEPAILRHEAIGYQQWPGPPPDPKTSTAPTVEAGAPESAEAEIPFLPGRNFKNRPIYAARKKNFLRRRDFASADDTRRIRFYDSSTRWPTRIPAALSAPFGVAELHAVYFAPHADRGGKRPVVSVHIPEADEPMVSSALEKAQRRQARLVFVCDTADQADQVAGLATRTLSNHRRVALERALAGGWGLP